VAVMEVVRIEDSCWRERCCGTRSYLTPSRGANHPTPRGSHYDDSNSFDLSPYSSTMAPVTLTTLDTILQAEEKSSDALEGLLTLATLSEDALSSASTKLWIASRDGIMSNSHR